MSTRSVIARPSETGFTGVYHHFDGYPSGVGQSIWRMYHDVFDGDADAMAKVLIDDHRGWSSIVERDFRLAPRSVDTIMFGTCKCGASRQDHFCQYAPAHERTAPCRSDHAGWHLGHLFDMDEQSAAELKVLERTPECDCHDAAGELTEGDRWVVTEENASGSGCEFAYVIDTADGHWLRILSSYIVPESKLFNDAPDAFGQKMVGMWGMGDPDAEWRQFAAINLDGEEPDWEQLTKVGFGGAADEDEPVQAAV
jgi:hypothetical protein